MKKLFYTGLLFIFCTPSYGQFLTQSAEGKGSFLFKGANIGFDLAKTAVSFTINNMNRPVKVDPTSNTFFFFGGGLNAKSDEGIGNLFSRGDFVPSGDMNGYFGWRFSNSYDSVYKRVERDSSALLQQKSNEQIARFIARMSDNINTEVTTAGFEDATEKRLVREWITELKKGKPGSFRNYLKSYLSKNNLGRENSLAANVIAGLLTDMKELFKEFDDELDDLRTHISEYNKGFIKSRLWRFSIFAFGGAQASSFKRVDQVNTTNLPGSFMKEEFRGGNIGVGMNYQNGRWKFGVTYSYRKTNNFNQLDKTDYKLTSTYTAGGQTLTAEQPITAYSGTYGEVEINELNADVLLTIDLGEEADSYVMFNPYYRGNLFSRNKTLIPTSYNLGLGGYFFTKKSKLLGGLYVELPDVDDSIEKSKPATDQHIRPALRRLTFGVVAKIGLGTLISWQ